MDEKLEIAIEQLRQGEQQGFQILYDQTHNYVLMQARALLKNEADVHDLVQEVYFNAYRSIGSLQENKKVYAWLGGIAFRQATKILRKQKDIPIGEEETAFDTMIELDEDIQPEHALDKKESAQILREMLEELPELQKAALLAYYYDEMSVGEIAKAFSSSEGTIKSRLNYARKNLKKAIQEREERDGIKLHSFSLPLLLLAFQVYAGECVMGEQMVSGIFQGVCQRIGNMAAGQAYPNQPSGHKPQNPTSQVAQNTSSTAMDKMGGTQQAIGKAAGKIAAGSAKGGIPAKAILFVASAVGAVSIGAGIAGYGLMHKNGASQGGIEAGQRQVISELGALNPGISNAVQGVAVEINGIEEKAAKAKEVKEKAEALKKKKAKKKKEEAKKAAEAAEAASSVEAQPDSEMAAAPAPEPVTETAAPSVQQPQTPEPTPEPEQPAPEPAPEQPAPEPAPEQPAPEPTPEPEPAPEPTPENTDDGWGNQAPDLTIEE